MSDDKIPEEKQDRPNSSYKLSVKNYNDDGLNFRYSREERLAKAPQSVRDLYITKKRRFSFLGPLIDTKGRALLFGSILLIFAAIMAISIFSPDDTYNLDGNSVSAQAMKFEGTIIVLIKKTVKKSRFGSHEIPYTGVIDIGASPVKESNEEQEPEIFYHRIFFTAENQEEFRFSLPFETDNILLLLQTEKSQASFVLKAE